MYSTLMLTRLRTQAHVQTYLSGKTQKHNLHSKTTFSITSLKWMHFLIYPTHNLRRAHKCKPQTSFSFFHKCWHFTSQGFHWSTKGDACGDIRFYHWTVLSQIKQMAFSDWCPELCLNGAMAAIWQLSYTSSLAGDFFFFYICMKFEEV